MHILYVPVVEGVSIVSNTALMGRGLSREFGFTSSATEGLSSAVGGTSHKLISRHIHVYIYIHVHTQTVFYT